MSLNADRQIWRATLVYLSSFKQEATRHLRLSGVGRSSTVMVLVTGAYGGGGTLWRVTRRGQAVVLVAGVVALLYSWVAAGRRPFTTSQEVMVVIPVLAVLLVALLQPSRPAPWVDARASLAVWPTLAVVALAWQLVAYSSSPRRDHPTLSSIADDIMSDRPGRTFVFLVWLALGWSLVARARTEGL